VRVATLLALLAACDAARPAGDGHAFETRMGAIEGRLAAVEKEIGPRYGLVGPHKEPAPISDRLLSVELFLRGEIALADASGLEHHWWCEDKEGGGCFRRNEACERIPGGALATNPRCKRSRIAYCRRTLDMCFHDIATCDLMADGADPCVGVE